MATTIHLLQMSDTMTEGALAAWLKEEGDEVWQGDPIAEIETDKATMEIEAPEDGVLLRRLVEVGVLLPVGTAIAVVGREGETIPVIEPMAQREQREEEGAEEPTRLTARTSTDEARLRSSPSARKLARSAEIDLRTVAGSGPGGRIVRRDIEAAVSARKEPPPVARPVAPSGGAVPLSRLRKKMIERLVATHQTVPTFSLTRRIRMDAAHAFRDSLAATETFADGIGYTELLVKAIACAMKAEPGLNARFGNGCIHLIEDVNVGIAVGLEEGVVVPVIRNCRRRDLKEIRDEFRRITTQAKSGNLLAEDVGNSTFTMSNLGMFGVEEFTAILNAPDAAIIAVGAINPRPVVNGAEIRIAQIMAVTLTVDHRVADGVRAARWLQAFAKCVENPVNLLVE